MAEVMYRNYQKTANEWGNKFLTFVDPDMNGPNGATKDWFGADFSFVLSITAAYLLFVVLGTMIMKNPNIPAMNTKPLQFIYNPIQIFLCGYMCIEAGVQAYRAGYSIMPFCNKFNSVNPPIGPIVWVFYISKILDFFDTFFIIMGKRWKQLSVLHVYHHFSIFMVSWMNLRVGYDGEIYVTVLLNAFIHTIMYTYYFLCQHTKDIWWKKYLTVLQMIQFLIMNIQGASVVLTGCRNFPPGVVVVYVTYVQSIFWLFANFFMKSYSGKSRSKAALGKKIA